MHDVAEEAIQVCTFKLGNLLFGIDVLSVQEVIKHRQLTPVPRGPEVVDGLLNLRGQILTAIDLRRRLDLPEAEGALERRRLIIVRASSASTALLVDSVGEVKEVTRETFEEPPGNVPESVRQFLLGVHNIEGGILHLLDAKKTSSLSGDSTL